MAIFKLSNKATAKVPDSEYEVLCVLNRIGESHAPAIARASNGSISVAGVYTLLGRLEARGLVQKRREDVPAGDISVKRVLYKVDEFAKQWLFTGDNYDSQRDAVTEGATA